jgi:DNA polymerase-3 subunit beta
MQFSIQREALLKPLQQVVGVVERRQTLPVLANLLVKVADGRLSFTGTDLEVEMVATTEADKLDDLVCHGESGRALLLERHAA